MTVQSYGTPMRVHGRPRNELLGPTRQDNPINLCKYVQPCGCWVGAWGWHMRRDTMHTHPSRRIQPCAGGLRCYTIFRSYGLASHAELETGVVAAQTGSQAEGVRRVV